LVRSGLVVKKRFNTKLIKVSVVSFQVALQQLHRLQVLLLAAAKNKSVANLRRPLEHHIGESAEPDWNLPAG
jgi:hypothetical protein